MPRRAQPVAARRVVWLSWKLVTALSALLCLLGLISLHRHRNDDFSPVPPALALARSRIPRGDFSGRPKIAFLFLARGGLPLDFLWGRFLEDVDSANFSIYVHSSPGFVLDHTTSRSRFFHNRQVKNSIQVRWGEASMILAERLLLAAALEDPANQRFVLLSDSCVPLYNFSYIYGYIMASTRSFVESFLNTNEGRYNPKMYPKIPKDKWRKGSQWISLVRSHAEVIVDDDFVFPVFEKFCKRRPKYDPSKGKLNDILQRQHNCIPDEHYVQTLLTMSGLEHQLERRTLTYTLWNNSVSRIEDTGWHPVTFRYSSAGFQQIQEIKDINHVYYETEYRTEWCRTNGTPVPCFLFARKFTRGAAMRLLSDGVMDSSDATPLVKTSDDA